MVDRNKAVKDESKTNAAWSDLERTFRENTEQFDREAQVALAALREMRLETASMVLSAGMMKLISDYEMDETA